MPNELRTKFFSNAHDDIKGCYTGEIVNLPVDFIFSQTSLQDFSECRCRFFLRYVQNLAWPAPPAEPFLALELALQRGARFHHIVHQHLTGCPAERIEATTSDDPELNGWWQNYLEFYRGLHLDDIGQGMKTYTEYTLVGELRNQRFLAKYDLIMVHPSHIKIVDWKTGRQKPGGRRRHRLSERWQTNLYPWLICRVGESLRESGISAEDVEMVYWFANNPTTPEHFSFSHSKYEDVEDRLISIVDLISGMAEIDFVKTDDARNCLYCSYRSLCDRGVEAGLFEAEDADGLDESSTDLDFDFAQIEEIPYLP